MKTYISYTIIILLILFIPSIVHAQEASTGTAISYPITIQDANVPNGSIISATNTGFRMSRIAYDTDIFAITSTYSAIEFDNLSNANQKQTVVTGEALVRVSSINGEIKANDKITSSTIPGAGQKATQNGQVIGTALQGYKNSNTNAVGTIKIMLDIHFDGAVDPSARGNIFGLFRNAGGAAGVSPISALRYILAALVILMSFVIGFIYFGRLTTKGVEAIGRNPLAGRMIQATVILNIFFTVLIVLTGLGIAYLLLIL